MVSLDKLLLLKKSLQKDYLHNKVLLNWIPEIYHDTQVENILNIISSMYVELHEQISNIPDSIDPGSDFFVLSAYLDSEAEAKQIEQCYEWIEDWSDEILNEQWSREYIDNLASSRFPEPGFFELPTIESRDAEAQQKIEFLEWFAGWVNLTLGEEWDYEHKRRVLKKILPLYKKRGTVAGLAEYLKIYAGESISILDDQTPLQIENIHSSILGVNTIIDGFPPSTPAMVMEDISTIDDDSVIEGFPPYFFIVRAAVTESGSAALRAKRRSIIRILEMEKPAHTWYQLKVTGPTFKLHDNFQEAVATLGYNTII